MKKIISFFLLATAILPRVQAQNNRAAGPWKGKQCAVVLTYDDALNEHQSNALPLLDSLGLKGTFYLSDYSGALQGQIRGWRAAAARGHELGNHTVFHPCEGGRPGREFVTPDYDLNRYTHRRITDEIRTMNVLLNAIDGKTKRTFAFPCSDTRIHDTAYFPAVKGQFVAARAVRSELPAPASVKLDDIGCFMVNGQSGDELVAQVRQAMEKKALLVFLFHGVGGGHGLNVSLPAHRRLLHFLKENEKAIWTAPMIEVAEFVQTYQQHQ
ncbi:polysaccharide deacetylase family protein [Paraflavisolibacter sp. H34]|uniref:polysaccharide deacetylase family protein n=1 Tax=Huijunlia imazamoxiresistens TaxID=3127457 RepID=UPI00301987F5